MTRKWVPAAWAPLIDAYCLYLGASGHTPPTITLRRGQLTYLARELKVGPAKLAPDDLVAWFGRQTWKTETRRSYRAGFRGFFEWAHMTGRTPDNLGTYLPRVRQMSGPPPRPVLDLAWRSALANANPMETIMLRLAAEAGLRRAEVAKVHVRDVVDSHNGPQLVVRGKGDKTRVVPISHSLAESILAGAAGHTPAYAAYGTSGYLFPGSCDGHLTPQYVGGRISRLLPPGYSIHKLRTRYATRAFRGSRNIRAVQQLLGHSSIQTTAAYTAVDDDEIRAAAMMATMADE